ncbi:MAG: hypothetical protein ABIZ04_21890 [Opitutus sp.]
MNTTNTLVTTPSAKRPRNQKPQRFQTVEESAAMCAALTDITARLHEGGIEFTCLEYQMDAPRHTFFGGKSVVFTEEQRLTLPRTGFIRVRGTTAADEVVDKWLLINEAEAATKENYEIIFC